MTSPDGGSSVFFFDQILEKAFEIPGVRVDRTAFLLGQSRERGGTNQDQARLSTAGLSPFFTEGELTEMGRGRVLDMARNSTAISVASGLPGGLWGAATGLITDTLQIFIYAIRISQELAYLYGYQIFCDAAERRIRAEDKDRIILLLGVFFGVERAEAVARLSAKDLDPSILAKLPSGSLATVLKSQVIERILAAFQVKFTKAALARGTAKVIPGIGAMGAGGFNYASMRYSGYRLNKELAKGFKYTVEKQQRDLESLMTLDRVTDFR